TRSTLHAPPKSARVTGCSGLDHRDAPRDGGRLAQRQASAGASPLPAPDAARRAGPGGPKERLPESARLVPSPRTATRGVVLAIGDGRLFLGGGLGVRPRFLPAPRGRPGGSSKGRAPPP